MISVIGVRFKRAGKIYYFDPENLDIKRGGCVIVETARGVEFGEVLAGRKEVSEEEIVSPLKKVIRIATPEDYKQVEENKKKEKEAHSACMQKIKEHKLNMKLISVEYTFDRNKVLFYFTADGRVDFRELVKDLAAIFKTRIELRQIGVRDEAKMLGGLGICGKRLCCSAFLDDFEPVSIKMAKDQSLSLNPTKISGICGRLMCCLKYEHDTYEELIKITPRVSAIVSTPAGQGTVIHSCMLKGIVKVRLDKGDEKLLQAFNVADVKVIKDVEVHNEVNLDNLKHLED